LRRALEIFALVLFLAGLELAAGTLSHTAGRFEETLRLVLASDSPSALAVEFAVGSVLVVFSVVIGALTLWAGAQVRGVHTSDDCPRCGGETERVKRKRRHRLLAAIVGQRVTRRRCSECPWRGLSIKY